MNWKTGFQRVTGIISVSVAVFLSIAVAFAPSRNSWGAPTWGGVFVAIILCSTIPWVIFLITLYIVKGFRGSKPHESFKTLGGKAGQCAICIIDVTNQSTKFFFSEPDGTSRRTVSNEGRVYVEFCIFYLHYMDRLAFAYFPEKQRHFFMAALTLEMACLFSQQWDGTESTRDKYADEFVKHYSNVANDYARYKKLFSDKGEPPNSTLFWEAAKRICQSETSGTNEEGPGLIETMRVLELLCSHITCVQTLFSQLFPSKNEPPKI